MNDPIFASTAAEQPSQADENLRRAREADARRRAAQQQGGAGR